MAKGIVAIGVAAETGQFSKDIASGVVKPLADAEKTITELASTTTASSDKIEAALEAQQRATTQTARGHQQATRQIQENNDEQVASFELSAREQNRIQKETLKTGAGAVAQSLAQTAQGFDGTVDGALETGTNIAATLGSVLTGPWALIAGAATLAFGVISGLFTKSADDSKQFKSDVDDLGQSLVKAGNAGKLAFSDVADELENLTKESDSTKTSLADIERAAHVTGTSYKDLAQAYAGATGKLKTLAAEGKRKLADDQTAARIAQRQTQVDAQQGEAVSIAQQQADFRVRDGLVKTGKAQEQVNEYVDEAAKKAKAAAKEYELWVKAGGPQMQELADRTKDLDGAFVDAVGDASKFIDKQGEFDATKFIKAVDAERKELKKLNDDLAKSGLSTAAKEYLDTLPPAQAEALLQNYAKQTPKIKSELNKDWGDIGKANSGTYSKVFENTKIKAPKVDTPTITQSQINSFRTEAQKKIAAKPLTVTVNYKIGKRVT